MAIVAPVTINGHPFIATMVRLLKITLLTASSLKSYIMCGALAIGLLNDRLNDRKIIAERAVGVKTIEELRDVALESSRRKQRSFA
jgi:uncharacterized protein YunC (DUF1805 family)